MILDTNALSGFIDGAPAAGAALRGHARLAIPVIVLGEFRYGMAGSRHRAAYESWLLSNLPAFDILPVTEDTTIEYARIRDELKKSGQPIPANDAWIAAIALEHGLPVLSRDRHFDVVPRLKRVSW